jgi:hypothetical protein
MIEADAIKRMVESAADMTAEARTRSERDRDYYDHHQWTAEEKAVLARRKQPPLVINRIQRKIDAMIGIEQRMRTDPRAYPRNPENEPAADVATKALVYVDDLTRFDSKRSAAFENMLIEGYGGVEVGIEERRGRPEIIITRLRWEEIIFDPHSREKDFSDATYLGVVKWMTLDAAVAWLAPYWQGEPEALAEMVEASMGGLTDSTFEDRPAHSQFSWSDRKLKRVRVAQVYYQYAGQWHMALLAGGGAVTNAPSPYLDEDGKPCCPLVLMTAYIDRENRRYGLVRSLIDMQDEVNKRRSKLLHMLNSRLTMGVRGAVDVQKAQGEKAKPDGHIEFDPAYAEAGIRPFEFVPQGDQVAGQFNLLVESKNEIDLLGPNAALLGQVQGQQSGRAIIAQQQAGLAELAPLYDSLRDWTIRVYRAVWSRIRQYWTDERWVRVTSDVQSPQFLQINRVVGVDPFTGQPVVENSPAEMDVDILIDEAPDYVTLRQEQFEQLTAMAQAGIPIPPELLIEASSLRDKQSIIERMQAQQQAAAQAAQAQGQMEAAKVEGDVALKQAQAQRQIAAAAVDAARVEQTEAKGKSAKAAAVVDMLSARAVAQGFPPPG